MSFLNALLQRFSVRPPLATPDSGPRRDWLKQHALAVKTVRAERGFEDLAGLAAMIGDARVVGLGEGTHGTREHFQMKHRLLEFLVEKMGFSIFAIEAGAPEAQELDAYVLGGAGDVERLIGGMYFGTWNTEEVRDMVEWMRRFNAAEKARNSPRRVHFTGFDMQAGAVAIAKVREFLEAYEPEFAMQHAETFETLASFDPLGGGRGEFAIVAYRLPVRRARGKRLRLSGWIRTEALMDGWAGLWMRVDGPRPQFDNMQSRGPRGTTDWTAASVEFDVPQDATYVYFGLVMHGNGCAWFDDMRLELDGVAWSSQELGVSLDGASLKELVKTGPRWRQERAHYAAAVDSQIGREGRQSLRIQSPPIEEGVDVTELASTWQSVAQHVRDSRERFTELAGPEQAKWLIHNTTIVQQWLGFANANANASDSRSAHRDRCMAENVRWLAHENPDARIVLWAHNVHVSYQHPWMGANLREHFGSAYINVAFTSYRGRYYAMPTQGSDFVHKLQKAPANSFEAILETAGLPCCIVDLRTAKLGDPGSSWLAQARTFGGNVGGRAMDQHFYEVELAKQYDLLVYMRNTTAARQLSSPPARC